MMQTHRQVKFSISLSGHHPVRHTFDGLRQTLKFQHVTGLVTAGRSNAPMMAGSLAQDAKSHCSKSHHPVATGPPRQP
jgi:hypothetical protein